MSGATVVGAPSHRPAQASLTARIVPKTVPVGEPATLTSRLRPAKKGVRLVVQRRVSGRWVTKARPTTDAKGRATYRVPTSVAGVQKLRVLRKSSHRNLRATSRAVTIKVTATSGCTPRTALVDDEATRPARCLAARLDRWQAAGAMGIGQQLNVSNTAYLTPLTALGNRTVNVVGFDLTELAQGDTFEFPDPPLERLTALAQDGAVLSASWHPPNPHTGGNYDDRSWHDLGALLDPTTPEYAQFWADYAAKLELLRRFQDAGVAVVVRPFHEANGDWFWWGRPDPTVYRQLWSLMQQKTWAAGVHNVLWAYSFNAVTGTHIGDPVKLLPARVDLAGMDSYSSGALSTKGYAAVAAKVERMAFTEVGPYERPDGSWDPALAGKAARSLADPPIWSMLWFDDGGGKKQLSSLRRGPAWLDSCQGGFCSVGP